MPIIHRLSALEILDSRGRPTIQATCVLEYARGTASVPSGASTGSAEALELRDGDPKRYRGLGCRKAVANINGEIHAMLQGRRFHSQAELDQSLLELDGTPNKSRLGANTILAVSLAFARAFAAEHDFSLYLYFAAIAQDGRDYSVVPARARKEEEDALPRPTINLFSGGKHAGGQVSIQDVLVVPMSAETMGDALAMTYEVYQSAAELTFKKYGMRALTADEGGLAPNFPSSEAMLDDAVESISRAGFKLGEDVALAVDVAASQFYHEGKYQLGGQTLTSAQMIDTLMGWLNKYPIISLEDGLAEEDWEHWTKLINATTNTPPRSRGGIGIMGDDLLCTKPQRIRKAIDLKAANALLLKVNQIGTLTEAAHALNIARDAGWRVTVSARSGETEDNWLADLAVGWHADYIKIGSITQSERLAKYNRLLAIEAETGLPLAGGGQS
jgi:enolase